MCCVERGWSVTANSVFNWFKFVTKIGFITFLKYLLFLWSVRDTLYIQVARTIYVENISSCTDRHEYAYEKKKKERGVNPHYPRAHIIITVIVKSFWSVRIEHIVRTTQFLRRYYHNYYYLFTLPSNEDNEKPASGAYYTEKVSKMRSIEFGSNCTCVNN